MRIIPLCLVKASFTIIYFGKSCSFGCLLLLLIFSVKEGENSETKTHSRRTPYAGQQLQIAEEEDTFYSTLHIERQRRTNDIYSDLINKYSVSEFIKVCGRNSKPVKQFLGWLCDCTEEMLTDAKAFWVGYEPRDAFMPVIVAEVKGKEETVEPLFNKFQIIQRSRGHLSDEAQYVVNFEMTHRMEFTAAEEVAIHKCLSKHTDNLMTKHSNLLIVSASKIKSQNFGNENASHEIKTCIVLYVHVKGIIPFSENAFPTVIEGFPTDVREGTFRTYSNDFHERLVMGCQIVTAYNTACSLGGFVELECGKIGCLTCFHPFETEASVADVKKDPVNHSYFRKEVYQPVPSSYFEFGRLLHSIRDCGGSGNVGVDAAIIEITKRHRYPCTGAFPDAVSQTAGFSAEKPMVFNTGKIIERFEDIPIPCMVVKYGAGTGHTIGLLRLAGPAVRIYWSSFYPDDRVKLHQQLEVVSIKDQTFAESGDSGSLVFLVTKLGSDMEVRALGILVGGTDYGTTIVTPIWAVLDKLKLPLKLLSFENPIGLSMDPAHQRFERIESDVDMLKQTTEATKQTVSSLENKIDITDRKQDERSALIENKVSSLENKMDVTDRKQDERSALIENKVSSLENKMDVTDRKQDERSALIENKVSSLENKMDVTDRKQDERSALIENKLDAQHTDISRKIDALLNKMSTNK